MINMFHTFESSKLGDASQGVNNTGTGNATETRSITSRRTSTMRACEPCRKRKIRCNGDLPCETCQWYRKASSCHYTEPRQRQVPSRKSIEKITSALQDYRTVLQHLFPNMHPDSLVDLPREKLLELISKGGQHQPPSPATSQSCGVVETHHISPSAEAGELETLQMMPEQNPDNGPAPQTKPGVADEVNALSLSVKASSSYQGISSIMAVLRVMLWIYPESQTFFTSTPAASVMPSRAQSPPPQPEIGRIPEGVFTGRDGLFLLNSYFTYVHPMIPLLEEHSFRDMYQRGDRHDSRWLALLNIVFAMGSMAASDAEDKAHHVYFERAKQHLGGLDCLGSAHIETVQALAIMGGYYLHYLQLPNLANSVMGACLRMATGLGLHREYVNARPATTHSSTAFSVDLRRRVWWCVFVLDSWANMTLGRPSMGRWGNAITAKPPLAAEDWPNDLPILCLSENVSFCKIATQIEDALAITPLVPNPEMIALDNALVEWFKNLPQPLQQVNTQGIPESILSARTIMRWRYLLTRVVLHRPVLLNYAMRRMPYSKLRKDEKEAVKKCRDVARELVADIATNHRPNQMVGWNGLWFMYQAVMVPLLSLFSDPHESSVVEPASESIGLGLQTMSAIMHYSPTGKRSVDAASRIYEAAKRLVADTRSMMEQKIAASNPSASHARPPRIKTDMANHQSSAAAHTPADMSLPYSPNGANVPPTSNPRPGTIPPELSNHTPSPTDYYNTPTTGSFPHHQQAQAFHPYNPTNLPHGTSNPYSDIDIATMWDSLNWSNGWTDCPDSFDFPMESVGQIGIGMGWDSMGSMSYVHPDQNGGQAPPPVSHAESGSGGQLSGEMEVQWGVLNEADGAGAGHQGGWQRAERF